MKPTQFNHYTLGMNKEADMKLKKKANACHNAIKNKALAMTKAKRLIGDGLKYESLKLQYHFPRFHQNQLVSQ